MMKEKVKASSTDRSIGSGKWNADDGAIIIDLLEETAEGCI